MNVISLAGHAARAWLCSNPDSATKVGVAMARHTRIHGYFAAMVSARNEVCRIQLDTSRAYRSGSAEKEGACRPAWLQREIDHLSAQHYKLSAFAKSLETAKCMADFDRMLKRYT